MKKLSWVYTDNQISIYLCSAMKKIKLTNGLIALVDDADFARVDMYRWGVFRPKGNKTLYAQGRVKDENGEWVIKSMHRFIFGLTNPKEHCDHLNGNGLDNQRHNLSVGSASSNMRNTRKRRDELGDMPFDEKIATVKASTMTKYLFNIDSDLLEQIKKEVIDRGFDSVASFIRKLIHDYFKNK